MNTRLRIRLSAVLAALALAVGACMDTTEDTPDEPKTPSTLVMFDTDARELPEGVTVDADGNVYASLSPLGKLVRIADGSDTAEPFGAVDGLAEGDLGLLGLAVDSDGDVYGTVMSQNADLRGVWRFDAKTGGAEYIPGTGAIVFPNSVVFDGDTMYITDSVGSDGKGAVWRVVGDGTAALWAQSDLLAGDGSAGFGMPIGPNGIAVQDETVYVGLTEPAAIVAIPISGDGSPGKASVFADLKTSGPDDGPIGVDGIDIDDEGRIYVAAPILHEVVRVSADGTAVETVADASDGLDAPTSVVIGADALYISNFSAGLGALSNGKGPSVVTAPIST